MAKSLGLRIVAEGVETGAQFEVFSLPGCEIAQASFSVARCQRNSSRTALGARHAIIVHRNGEDAPQKRPDYAMLKRPSVRLLNRYGRQAGERAGRVELPDRQATPVRSVTFLRAVYARRAASARGSSIRKALVRGKS